MSRRECATPCLRVVQLVQVAFTWLSELYQHIVAVGVVTAMCAVALGFTGGEDSETGAEWVDVDHEDHVRLRVCWISRRRSLRRRRMYWSCPTPSTMRLTERQMRVSASWAQGTCACGWSSTEPSAA